VGGSANGREGGGWYTDAKPEGGGARDRGRRRRAGNERTVLRTYLRDVQPERFFGGRHERRPLVGLDFQTPEGHRAWWGWRRQVRLRVRRNGMRHRFCLQYFSWAQQAFWPRGRWHQPSLAHVDGIVARARSAWTRQARWRHCARPCVLFRSCRCLDRGSPRRPRLGFCHEFGASARSTNGPRAATAVSASQPGRR
jgi:hypothetical protein